MRLTLQTLYKDHDNLRRLLCLLEKLLIDIYRGSSEVPQMLPRILNYIRDYPSRIHHPAEYAVFSAISKDGDINRKFHEDVHKLMEDHSEIDDILRAAIEAAGPRLVGTYPDMTDLTDRLATLIARERAHLQFEEANIYPFVAEHLGNEDWENISALIPDYEDPIFGSKVRME